MGSEPLLHYAPSPGQTVAIHLAASMGEKRDEEQEEPWVDLQRK